MGAFNKKDFKPLSLVVLVLCLLTPLNAQPPKMTETTDLREQFAQKQGVFALGLYNELAESQPGKNIIFSPLSIQTCTAMVRMGAEGSTAQEIDDGLGLVSNDAPTIAQMFQTVLADYENSSILKIANRIYVMQGLTIKSTFHDLVTKKFYAGVENMDFTKSTEAALAINSWVESKTNNLIKDLVDASMFDDSTRMVLLNAIHFKGEWVHPFKEFATHDDDFYLNEVDSVKVSMMKQKARFNYADLPDLDATALEMRYKDSDLSMVVILPNSKTGLKQLEAKLKNVPLSEIVGKMSSQEVIVKLPKFKAEFSAELTEPFKKLGMSRMFSESAEFGNILESKESLAVSKIIHKAFIEVNEAGTEAAAATVIGIMQISGGGRRPKSFFSVKHPFVFFVKNKMNLPVFHGSVVTLESSKRFLKTIN